MAGIKLRTYPLFPSKVQVTAPLTLTKVDGEYTFGFDINALVFPPNLYQPYDPQLFAGAPVNSQSANYTAIATDANKCLLHPVADNNARFFSIPGNATVPFQIGTRLSFVNEINTVTISIIGDTLMLAGAGTLGPRTLAANGVASALKITATKWMIWGFGLT